MRGPPSSIPYPFLSGTPQGKEDSQWSQGLVSAARLVASVIGSLCEAANTVIQVVNNQGADICVCLRRGRMGMFWQQLQSKSPGQPSNSSWLARYFLRFLLTAVHWGTNDPAWLSLPCMYFVCLYPLGILPELKP